MKRVKCQSGIEGAQEKLHNLYSSYEDFHAWSDIYGLAKRLGYKSAETAWKTNPTVEFSTNPSDYRKVRSKARKIHKKFP
jgi:hypothetical protein